jgi:Zn-dependent protease/predicted transcriptional regulator
VAFSEWQAEQKLSTVLDGVTFMLAIFTCVLLHELGHALVAQRYGIKTTDITLLPIGGLARLERMPEDPKQEISVALAGPAVNVVIALALFMGTWLLTPWKPVSDLTFTSGSLIERLMAVNIVLVLFNLLPAFPMDGGRVIRGLLALRLKYSLATRIAAKLGQCMALLFVLTGLFFAQNPFLVFIGVFVWFGAAQESSIVEFKSALGDLPVERAMPTCYTSLTPTDLLSRAVELVLAGCQEDFPVVENGRVVGVLQRPDLVNGLAIQGESAVVADFMKRNFPVADAAEKLQSVVPRLESSGCKIIPVTRFGELVGLLTTQNIAEFMMIRSALSQSRQHT